MRRLHLIELHEQTWYPASCRELFQRLLGSGVHTFRLFDHLAETLDGLFARVGTENILDLCSGSGEAAVSVWEHSASLLEKRGRKLHIVLSDLFPNLAAYERLRDQHGELIEFYPQPVNALSPPADAPGLWSMIESLHHFRPDDARAILQNAANKADGFLALESTGKTWKHFLLLLTIVPFIAAWTTTFQLRPIRFRNVLWGLLLPLVPFTASFDGIVSSLRTYTKTDLEDMIASIESEDFSWRVGTAPVPDGPGRGLEVTYVLGWRNKPGDRNPQAAP